MTGMAFEIFMCLLQFVISLFVMIENPTVPCIGIVADLALLAEGLLVYVVFFVAFDALAGRVAIVGVTMAIFAGNSRM